MIAPLVFDARRETPAEPEAERKRIGSEVTEPGNAVANESAGDLVQTDGASLLSARDKLF